MFRSVNQLCGYCVAATDGECGLVSDFLFDDKERVVRYVVVRTGGWLMGRDVLISPVAITEACHKTKTLTTVLTKQMIENAPGVDTEKTVSRQQEISLVSYFDWPMYWAPIPVPDVTNHASSAQIQEVAEAEWDTHLRSMREVVGYHVHCISDKMGHVEDLIIDLELWIVRYLVIDTTNWLPGKKVIVGCDWLTDVRWEDKSVYVDLTRKQIETAPPYFSQMRINRDYETTLYDFYGRPTYWSGTD